MINGVKIASTGQVEPLNASNYCNGVHDNADYVNNAEFMSACQAPRRLMSQRGGLNLSK